LNTLIAIAIKLLEFMFVIGAVGCLLTVIPTTAYRLVMVLFEPSTPEEEVQILTPANHEVAATSSSQDPPLRRRA
jgi:hypothetical protein